MSAAPPEPKLEIRICQPIQQDSHLLGAVTHASQFLTSEYAPNPLSDETQEARLTWALGQLDGPVVVAELAELDHDGSSRSSRRFIPRSQVSDPNSMNIWMLRLLRGVNRERYEKVSRRWAKRLDDAERAEADGR